jgi:hypothetical protein
MQRHRRALSVRGTVKPRNQLFEKVKKTKELVKGKLGKKTKN